MKKLIALTLAAALPSLAYAADGGPLDGADFVVICVSDKDGGTVTLARSGATDTGFIDADKIRGEAKILPGVNSLTFLHIKDQDVVTFVVDFEDLSYDMSIKGQHVANDRGTCQDPVS
ncbi:hypothetical protein [Ruegeria sp.]|uniref:hypothetical protein n=1 Tax=Ruegeria sp. TaxID=1879320 RepID=UPI002325299A|nr:hypothetical protein [Ruegeria sp.]MDA7963210.1 hypothetical protein [Ruegeria sp.]